MSKDVKSKATRSLREVAARFFTNIYRNVAKAMKPEDDESADTKVSRSFHIAVARNQPQALRAFEHFDVASSTISQANAGDKFAIDAIRGHRASRVIRNRPRLKAMLEAA